MTFNPKEFDNSVSIFAKKYADLFQSTQYGKQNKTWQNILLLLSLKIVESICGVIITNSSMTICMWK